MKGKRAWSDQEAARRLGGLPSEESEVKAEKFFSSISSQNSITDEEALEILTGRRPKKIVRESTSQKQSERPSADPIVAAIEAITAQIEDVLEAERRREQVLEVIRAK